MGSFAACVYRLIVVRMYEFGEVVAIAICCQDPTEQKKDENENKKKEKTVHF